MKSNLFKFSPLLAATAPSDTLCYSSDMRKTATLHLRIAADLKAALLSRAAAQHRPLTNYIETILLTQIARSERKRPAEKR